MANGRQSNAFRVVEWQIDLNEPLQVDFWANALNVDEEDLRSAVDAVGPSTGAILNYLTGYPSPCTH